MKPILFNTEMVRAILDGHKSVTRRLVKPQPVFPDGEIGTPARCDDGSWCFKIDQYHDVYDFEIKPPYQTDDILYVREAWQQYYYGSYAYRAGHRFEADKGWRPSIHMPKEAARLFLLVTNVRVERLRDITDDQLIAEGISGIFNRLDYGLGRYSFSEIWDGTIPKGKLPIYGWEANPWVWVIKFETISKEEAQKGGA